MNILFRTSGGRIPKKQLGLGHIYRCVNLSKELKSHKLKFLVEDYGSVHKILKENKIKIFKLKPGISQQQDIKKTLSFISKNKIELIIIDKFDLKYNFLKEIKKVVKVIVISDLQNIEYDADLVINGFIDFKNGIKYNKFGVKCMLGPKYQILNKSYKKKENIKKKYDLFITVGGYDANNIIEKVLTSLVKFEINFRVLVVLGPATKITSKIKKIRNDFRGEIKIIHKTNNMKKLISQSKFGICGGGITTYEFAISQVPFAIICQYEHQIFTSKAWAKKKIARNLGFIEQKQGKIDRLISDIVNKKIALKKINIDALGSQRISNEISKMG